MNLTSYMANKCFEFLLSKSIGRDGRQDKNSTYSKQNASRPLSSTPPPWVPDNQILQQNCDSCGNCIAGCENTILVRDEDGFPRVDFSKGSCSFCGNCARSCPNDVFDYAASRQPWDLKAFITSDCLSRNNVLCRICAEHCEEEAIVIPKTGSTMGVPRIQEEKCSGCGACCNPCPVEAINIIRSRGSEKV